MATYYKYEKYQKYINGVPQDEYKQGNLIGTGEYSSLQDCEEGAIYKWIDSGETICDGYKLCVKEIKQKSTDGGNTWVTTSETRAGTVIDMWSTECGAEILYRWNPTGKTRCNGYNKEEEYVYQVSYTMGTTWEDVEPRQTKWEVTDVFTDECFLAAEPFTFTFDAGEEGGQLELNTTISTLYSYSAQDGPYGPPYSQDVDYYIIYWSARAISKYAIDWGEGEEVQIQTVTKIDSASERYHKDWGQPDNPFINKAITNSTKLPNHIYRTGGVKTIKIWGNISYFGCKQVKDLIHWGHPMYNSQLSINSQELLALLKKQGIKVGNLKLTQAKVEGYDNFNKVETTFTGTTFGTMYIYTFKYLTHFDMSNSPNIVNPNPFSNFNQGRLKTFIADNCRSLQWTPDLHYLGNNDNSSRLTSISFKGCTNLKYVRPIEMLYVYVSGGASTTGLNLTTGGVYKKGVFEGCLNIEEFNFGYDVYVNSIDFKPYTKLKKITGNLLMDDTIYNRPGQFYQFCKGLPELQNIDNLTLKGSYFDEAFMDCPKIKAPCTTIIRGSSDGYAQLQYMYSNTGIVTLDISKIYQNETDPDYLLCDSMFENCLELTTVTNSLQVNQHVKSRWSYSFMFEGCSHLTTISPIFKDKTDLPDLHSMFKNCNIQTIPNNMFNRSYEGVENTPTEMFANNVNLTNYPVFNGLPMWKMPPFFFTGITWAHTFTGCPLIAAEVPVQWGGILGGECAKFKIEIPRENYTFRYINYTENTMSVITLKSDGARSISTNGELLFPNPGIYTLEVYYTGQGDFWITIPDNTTEILDWGNAIDIHWDSFTDYPYSNPVLYFDVTKLPYGKNLFSRYGTFNGYLEGSFGDRSIWYKIKNITDVDDNILQNCGNVTKLGKDMWGGYSSFSMSLSEQKYTAMLSYLTNLSEVHRLFDWDNEVIATFTTTCGIFKNNPGLTNIQEAFADSKLQTIPVDEFSNNKELVNVSKVFLNSTELTNMPNFLENKKITNFSQAFDGCSKLTGSTPVDENGYKLWQRAGKQGYPATINGEHCFRGCTQLDDYDEIPSNWK